MPSLQEALSSAFDAAEAGEPAPVEKTIEAPAEETAEQKAERARDEAGRFTKQEKAEVKAEPEPITPAPTPTAERKPPTSWKKDYWGHWEKIGQNPELAPLQDYINQRESEAARGVSQYKQQWEQVAPIAEAIQPFMPDLQQYGIEPKQWITNLGNAHKTLALGTPEQKVQMFARLATEYGVPLEALTGQQNPQMGYVAQTLQQVQQELNQFKTSQQKAEEAKLLGEIDVFKQKAPHFEAVRESMAQLLQSGIASDLQTAYDKAIRLNDEVWQAQQAEQAKAQAAQHAQEIAKKRAAAVSPRSASPTGTTVAGGSKKGLRDILEDSFESVSTGRF
jgi:hypothetical protein